MALHERARSGRGQYLDMTLHDCGMALLHPSAANYLLSGKRPVALGNPHSNVTPYDSYPTATCNVFLAIGNDAQFRKLAAAIGQPELATDPRFTTNALRGANRPALTVILVDAFVQEDGHALADRLSKLGLPAGPVLHVDEALAAPHTAAREMVTTLGGYRALGTPIKLSRTPGGTHAAPPKFGEHGAEIMAEHGYSEAEVSALVAEGIVFSKRKQ